MVPERIYIYIQWIQHAKTGTELNYQSKIGPVFAMFVVYTGILMGLVSLTYMYAFSALLAMSNFRNNSSPSILTVMINERMQRRFNVIYICN